MSIWDAWAKIPGYSQVVNNPTFAAAAPQFVQGVHDALFNSGIAPSSSQLELLNGGGVEANPYSVVAMLKKQNATQNHATINAANAANLEESGAAVGGLNANSEAYKQNYANEAARVGSQISGLLGNFTNTVGGIFGTLENNPTPVPTATPAPTGIPPLGAPGLGTGVGTGRPTPQQPYTRTGPEAGYAVPVAKKLKPGVVGGLGHIT